MTLYNQSDAKICFSSLGMTRERRVKRGAGGSWEIHICTPWGSCFISYNCNNSSGKKSDENGNTNSNGDKKDATGNEKGGSGNKPNSFVGGGRGGNFNAN